MEKRYNPKSLAYFLFELYGINDPASELILLSTRERKIIEHYHYVSRIPKSFRNAIRKRRKQKRSDSEEE